MTKNLHWPLIALLAAIALLRPIVCMVADQLGVDVPTAVPLLLTAGITVVWVAVVGISRMCQPVLTLTFAGLGYAVFAIILSAIASPVLLGRLEGPFANPIGIVPMLALNAVWGACAGLLAMLVQRALPARGSSPRRDRE